MRATEVGKSYRVNFVQNQLIVPFKVEVGGGYSGGYRYPGIPYQLKCRWLPGKIGAFEIITNPTVRLSTNLIHKQGKVWLGINNIEHRRANPDEVQVDIKRHIRHLSSYR